MYKPKIGITIGDINGIGAEVIIKTLANKAMLNQCTPVIYGSVKLFNHYKKLINEDSFQYDIISTADHAKEGKINMINCWDDDLPNLEAEVSETAGRIAHISLDHCVDDIRQGLVDAMVTAPINKKSMQLASFGYPGHTEYLESEAEGNALMMLCHGDLRVALVTAHIPLSEVSEAINKEKIVKTIKLLNQTLIIDFDIERPNIAVLGLNPHAGDEGVLGEEEEKVISPAIAACKEQEIFAHGPFAADGFFGSGNHKKYDAVVAMYHDQGLVVFKSLAFGSGVNFTAGLDIIRTSPDHGTGFDIVGKGIADESSFRTAMYAAIDIQRNRHDYHEFRKNKLKPSRKRSERR